MLARAPFPVTRPRRLRATSTMRSLVRETTLTPQDFIYPLFVRDGHDIQHPIRSMPGQYQWSPDLVAREARQVANLDIPAVILFGIPAFKDARGSENARPDGEVARAIRAIKEAVPDLLVISDMCFCEYTDHGHCGIINRAGSDQYDARLPEGY